MPTEHLILCGEASTRRRAETATRKIVRLSTDRRHGNVNLRIGDITSRMIVNLSDVAKDLVEIATYVYCADQAARRGGSKEIDYGERWRRDFIFEIPLRVPELWSTPDVLEELAQTLTFMADDSSYRFEFSKAGSPTGFDEYLEFDKDTPDILDIDEVLLFSGGLDSFGGAAEEIFRQKRRVALVSHRSVSKMDAWQRNVVSRMSSRCSNTAPHPFHVPVLINKAKDLGQDYNQRCRSFLYAALAAVVAVLFKRHRIRFFENGVVSFNLPISAQVIGARATRTTHPRVLGGFQRLFSQVFDCDFAVENPFLWKTKTEILRAIKALGLSDLCAHTVSCMHTWEMTTAKPLCGRCSQCIDRRLVVLGAGYSNSEDPPKRYKRDVLRAARRKDVDRTLVESYVRVMNEIEGIQNAMQFCTRFPEVARLLNHVDGRADDVAESIFDLYRRHAQQVCSALDREAQACIQQLRRGSLPESCLLRIAYGGSPGGRVRPTGILESPPESGEAVEKVREDPTIRKRFDRLKQMEREILQALYEQHVYSLDYGKLPSQQVVAKWAGYDCNTTFKTALASVVKVGFVDNGRHHGRRGGYFLTPDGRCAAQMCNGHD